MQNSQQLADLNTCEPEADTLLDNLEALSVDLPYIKPLHAELDKAINAMRLVVQLIAQEQTKLKTAKN